VKEQDGGERAAPFLEVADGPALRADDPHPG